MQIGQQQFPIQIAILFGILVLSVIFNIFLYTRGHGSYTIKYQLMIQRAIFRKQPFLATIIDIIYKIFFTLPFLLLIIIAILRAFTNTIQLATILVNGLIILLIIYPFKTTFFYTKEIIMWILSIASQLITLYVYVDQKKLDLYPILSSILYPLNSILFCIGLIAQQNNYWQVQKAIMMCQNQLKQIYQTFVQVQYLTEQAYEDIKKTSQKFKSTVVKDVKVKNYKYIPAVLQGGLYGSLCNYKKPFKWKLLYFLSFLILCLNAFLLKLQNSSLGIIGLITNFIYDLFIFSFNSMITSQRTLRNVFILVFFGRLLSFILGSQLWIVGYCCLYFFVGIFVGNIIICNRLPLKKIKAKKHKQYVNAFKTPQFVLFILTAQILVLVLAASLGVGNARLYINYSDQVSIPLWQFALLSVIGTWTIICCLASFRMYIRIRSKIRDHVQYYFGSYYVRQFHIYLLVTYAVIIALGFYANYILYNSTALIAAFYIPPLIIILVKLYKQWSKNQYQVLADITDYNRRVEKIKGIINKKQNALKNSKKDKNLNLNQKSKIQEQASERDNQETRLLFIKNIESNIEEDKINDFPFDIDKIQQKSSKTKDQNASQSSEIQQQIGDLARQKNKLQILTDWRLIDEPIKFTKWWSCLTKSDKWILILFIVITLFLIGFCLCTYFIANTIFGIFIVLCLVAVLAYVPFYRYLRTNKQIDSKEYIWFVFCWSIGVIYWIIFRNYASYALIWSAFFIFSAGVMIGWGIVKRIPKQYIYMMLLLSFLTIGLVIILIWSSLQMIGAAISSILIIVCLIALIPIVYQQIQGSAPKIVKGICYSVVIGGLFSMAIIAFVYKLASNFAIFSFICAVTYLIFFVAASIVFYQKQLNKFDCPHVYSAYGTPIYQFQSRTQKLKSSLTHKVLYDVAGIVLVVYSAVVTIAFNQKQYAIYVLGYYISVSFIQNILFSLKTNNQMANKLSQINKQVIIGALNDLNKKYMVNFKNIKPSYKLLQQKQRLIKDISNKQNQQLQNHMLKIAQIHYQMLNNAQQQQKFLFFWVALIQFNIFAQQKAKMVKLINEVREIQSKLIQYGIFFESVSLSIDVFTKHELLQKQIEQLHPFDYNQFVKILQLHQKQQQNKKQQLKKQSQKQQQQIKKKQQEIFNNIINKQGGSSAISQYQDMLKKLSQKNKYQDIQFPANQSILGAQLSKQVQKWRRPNKGQKLLKGQMNAYDVKQGPIGNCYLISSLGVLGDKWLKKSIGLDGSWKNQKGSYMIKFYKFSKQVFLIIDDILPYNNKNQPAFARSQQIGQLWPSILQKAYAKLYGGYNNIIAGKCHRVFAQFTGGFPTEIKIQSYSNNPNSLWQKIILSVSHGYLMGAGSPPHPSGDLASSARGIVQGHAYCILDARQVQDHKLIKLKNPHGSGKLQWSGDFSDTSQLMNDRLMSILQHKKQDDGVFWMCLDDFMHQFMSLYHCAIFDSQKWVKKQISGKFQKGKNSYGQLFPQEGQASQYVYKNPQYGIKVTKKCTLFVNLIQQAKNTNEGKNFMNQRIQRNNGKRIDQYNAQQYLLCGKQLPTTNGITQSNQAVLQADSYPYTFTLFLCLGEEDDVGNYKLQLYCNDKQINIIDDSEFDRQRMG